MPWWQPNDWVQALLLHQRNRLHCVPAGAVKRIRGVAHSMRVSPQSSNRMVDGARGVLNALLADVYIFSDHMSGPEAGRSPGFGTMLVAETTTGCLISAESTADVQQQVGGGTQVLGV